MKAILHGKQCRKTHAMSACVQSASGPLIQQKITIAAISAAAAAVAGIILCMQRVSTMQ